MIKHYFNFQNKLNYLFNNIFIKMPIKTLLKPTGPFSVGHFDMEFINPNDINSTILTRVFYPSSSSINNTNMRKFYIFAKKWLFPHKDFS